ncbi:hypothetical protein J1N44_17910 [Acidovorax temperans]|uniref:hypothetical protein n=1 Tax=Acidovorax temperans TaxID=80878 RepID=UPI001A94E217|nr:hypothetical protein [Acidovorax temperans]MBO0943533.1 hypothetical protein [Acidovorax temperans]
MTLYTKRGTRYVPTTLSEQGAWGCDGLMALAAFRYCLGRMTYLHHIEEPLEKVLERREAVIQILERDAHEAHQRAAHALGTRKVLWNLLGECSPLLHQLECNDHESEEQLNSLLRRIDDARAVVQAEELPNARP